MFELVVTWERIKRWFRDEKYQLKDFYFCVLGDEKEFLEIEKVHDTYGYVIKDKKSFPIKYRILKDLKILLKDNGMPMAFDELKDIHEDTQIYIVMFRFD